MARYAEGTTVNSQQSRGEIERTLERYGATGFSYGWRGNVAVVMFEMQGRQIRFTLPLPDREAREFRETPTGRERSEASSKDAYEQAVRQRWRALALLVKAQLEAIESGITTFERSFLANIVLPDGNDYGDFAVPQIKQAYQTGAMPQLLPGISPAPAGRSLTIVEESD